MDSRGLSCAYTSCTAWYDRPGCTVKMAMVLNCGKMVAVGEGSGTPCSPPGALLAAAVVVVDAERSKG